MGNTDAKPTLHETISTPTLINKDNANHQDENKIRTEKKSARDFKPKKKKIIKNEFPNLNEYVKDFNINFLIRDLNLYDKNIFEEENKILQLIPNIYINSEGVNIKNQIFNELENGIKNNSIQADLGIKFIT